MNKTRIFVIAGILVVLVAGAVQIFSSKKVAEPKSPVGEWGIESNSATSSDTTSAKEVVPTSHSDIGLTAIAKGDSITVWTFKGAYIDHPELVAKAEAEIKRLSGLIGTGKYSDTALYVSIANQYDLLGDGKQEYDYLVRAVKAGGSTTGLPWHNLGVLMTRLGALETARVAYQKATLVQPEIRQWHYAYLDFLIARMKDNSAAIEKAFAAALSNFGKDSEILQMQSEWKKS